MPLSGLRWIKVTFVLAGVYDGVLGAAFLLVPGGIFAFYGVEPPNHMAYVQFPSLLLILFALMFFRIAANPSKRREFIPYGCGLKLSFCTIVFWYEITAGIPSMWVPWAWADLAFFLLFLWAWMVLGRRAPSP